MNNYRLDRKVEVKAISTTRNALGESIGGLVHYVTRFAEVKAKHGSERFSSGADQASKRWSVRLRYDTKTAAINETMIVVYEGRQLQVESVLDTAERHRWIDLQCIEHSADNGGPCRG